MPTVNVPPVPSINTHTHTNTKIVINLKISETCCKRCNALAAWKLENLSDAITALLSADLDHLIGKPPVFHLYTN
jgi:hypothetical protein